jgi:hypothetical protein
MTKLKPKRQLDVTVRKTATYVNSRLRLNLYLGECVHIGIDKFL